jgi:hypothetical protein
MARPSGKRDEAFAETTDPSARSGPAELDVNSAAHHAASGRFGFLAAAIERAGVTPGHGC